MTVKQRIGHNEGTWARAKVGPWRTREALIQHAILMHTVAIEKDLFLLLRYVREPGVTLGDIGREIGISAGATQKRIALALQNLHRWRERQTCCRNVST